MATKKIVEKKTGEKYASKAAMAKHEKKESKAEQMKEYGKIKRTPAPKQMKPKGPVAKMKKC
jgi:N-acyl-D-aspartate/D-glutamate deacylase